MLSIGGKGGTFSNMKVFSMYENRGVNAANDQHFVFYTQYKYKSNVRSDNTGSVMLNF